MTKNIYMFVTLALLLSFPTLNAVLLTPALPQVTSLLGVSVNTMEGTFIWFLAGYCLGQLIYSPLNNRFGRKIALFSGIGLQILSSVLALYACYIINFNLLLFSRFCLAFGSGVGLMMTFTIVSEYYKKERVQNIIAYLTPAFALIPALGILLSGYFTKLYNWPANFIVGIIYGCIMLLLCSFLPASDNAIDRHAFNIKKIVTIYRDELRNKYLIVSGMLMGCCVAYVYIFSTIVPFVTMSYFEFNGVSYGIANGFSAFGLLAGAILTAKLAKSTSSQNGIILGVLINLLGSLGVLLGEYLHLSAFTSFFMPFFLINLGSCLVLSFASAMVLAKSSDKSNTAAAMSFMNVGTTTVIMLIFSHIALGHYLVALTFSVLSLFMLSLSSLI